MANVQCVVPLAGPDFVGKDGRIKALQLLDGVPLLQRTLMTRPWIQQGQLAWSDLTFVLLDSDVTRHFAKTHLQSWFPKSQTCFISDVTQGAAMSALSGLSQCRDFNAPLCVDLADILYDADVDPVADFEQNPELGGLALTFRSDWPLYSYLEIDRDGAMISAREKVVISETASAGTYFFRSAADYATALAYLIRNRIDLAYRDLLFVCPLLNGLVDAGLRVEVRNVKNVVDIKSGSPVIM